MASDGSASILVVDDNPENLRLLSSMLGSRGFDLRLVTSGRQALQAASSDPPDLVLLDITMPELNGYEVCERLKAIEALADVPVIFLTALSEMADKLRAFRVGGVDYITKPFQIEEVVARVTTHLALRKARVELASNYQRLQGLERLRDDLVHMVVHDMRSPLMIMRTHLDFLQSELTDLEPQQVEDLQGALAASDVLARMANDLLDVSKLEAGQMPLNAAACDLSAVANAVVRELGTLDRSRTIQVSAPEQPVQARCDCQLIRRVLANMIGNAIKHTPSGGRIQITLEPCGAGGARVAIQDQGPGVPPEARARIFEKFGTIADRSSSRFHSVGLGLAFCKLAVEAHGGRIGVDAAPAGGSVFWLELPG